MIKYYSKIPQFMPGSYFIQPKISTIHILQAYSQFHHNIWHVNYPMILYIEMSLYLVYFYPPLFDYCKGSVIFMWRFGVAWCATFVSWFLTRPSWVWPAQHPWVVTWRTCLLSKDKVKSSHTEPTKSSHRLDKVQTVLTRWHCSEEFGQGQDTCPTLSPWNLGYSNLPPCSHPSHVKSSQI